jgi:hypothetical protein
MLFLPHKEVVRFLLDIAIFTYPQLQRILVVVALLCGGLEEWR